MQETELLAPVGSWEALEAAVQSGADAVYLGGKAFNARQSAHNFDENELIRAVDYCHLRDVKVYSTVNTLVSNEEFKELANYILFLYNIDVDAVILQDLGVTKLIRDLFPDMELHGSTQMSIHNAQGVKLLENIGFKRAVLAREMSSAEIEYTTKSCGIDLEVFVHGALCIGYSGQCLMSSMIGGRSGNRGRCAQPCRMVYNLVNTDTGKDIIGDQGDYILSPRDLNTLENINNILDTGVKSLKIEGRMKRPEYVATVVSAYRNAVDQYRADRDSLRISKETLYDVEQIFNRGFTKGYILGDHGKDLMSFSKPSNRGIKVGEVISYDNRKQKVSIRLDKSLRKGDGIEIWTEKGDNSGAIVENIFIRGEKVEHAIQETLIEIPFRHYTVKGSHVYRTSDVDLLKRAREIYGRNDKQIHIYGAFRAEIGHEMELTLWDNHHNSIHTKSTYIVEKAQRVAIDENRVKEQLSKLGDTPYKLHELEIKLEKEAAIPIGELNRLRRTAIEELNKVRTNYNKRRTVDDKEFSSRLEKWFQFKGRESKGSLELCASVGNLNQLKILLKLGVNRVYYRDMNTLDEAFSAATSKGIELVPLVHRIMGDSTIDSIKKQLKSYNLNQGVMVGDLGSLHLLSTVENLPIYTDFSLNVFNNGALNLLEELGVRHVTLSPELTLKQMSSILDQTRTSCEAIIHGHLPLMVTKYCPVSAIIEKGNKQESCKFCRNTNFGLKDRLGLVFPMEMSDDCTIQILNAQKLCLIEHLKGLYDGGITNIRIHFTNEKEDEVIETITAYKEAIKTSLNPKIEGSPLVKAFTEKIKNEGYTKGHFFRGVI